MNKMIIINRKINNNCKTVKKKYIYIYLKVKKLRRKKHFTIVIITIIITKSKFINILKLKESNEKNENN